MSTEESGLIDEAVLVLLHDHVNTFDKLELLVMMGRDPNASWTLDGIAASFRIPTPDLMPAIDQLRAAGILRLIPGTKYKLVYSPTRELGPACTRLCRAYEDDRTTVTRILHELAISRANRASAEAFAEAFRLRRPIPEGTDE